MSTNARNVEPEKITTVHNKELFQPPGAGVKAPLFDMDRVWKLMDGAIDLHIHGGPDPYATRMASDLEIAIDACDAGMAAVVFKCHAVPTQRSATLIQHVVDKWAKEHGKRKTSILGGVVLGSAVGGLNPEAVMVNARLGGKYVWLPSIESAYDHRRSGRPGGIDVVDENDNVVPPLKEIFDLIAEADMVLGICHQSPMERPILIDEAKKRGVKRIEIVHALHPNYKMPIEELKAAVEKGVYIGLCSWSLAPPIFDQELLLQTIKGVDQEYLVGETDVGLFLGDRPVEALRRFISMMLVSGIPDEVVEMIVKNNPARLLHDESIDHT